MIKDNTLDEAMVEAARFLKAAKALRAARKAARAEDLSNMYKVAPPTSGCTPEDVKAAMEAPFRWPRACPVEHAACKRASLDLTRKLADLRAGR